MQVNAMAWLTVAWALLRAAMAERCRAVSGVLAVLSLAPLLQRRLLRAAVEP